MMLRRSGLRSFRKAAPKGMHRVSLMTLSLLSMLLAVSSFAPLPTEDSASAATPKVQLGINVLLYPEFGTRQQNLDAAARMFTYVRSLHANTVALCFQIYPIVTTPGGSVVTTNTVGIGDATPSPAYLGEVVDLAHRAGLKVQLRPLINEDLLASPAVGSWRGAIAPTDPAAWFASYTSVLKPFMAMARRHTAEAFVVGAEMTSMVKRNRYWVPLINLTKRLSGAEVIYESNWNPRESLPATSFGMEFYQPVQGLTSLSEATVANFTSAMEANLASTNLGAMPVPNSRVILSEVAVGARDKGWVQPWNPSFDPATQTIIRSVQANWFTAACNTVHDLGLNGLFFWTLILNKNFDPTASDDPAGSATATQQQAYNWQNTASSAAINDCFTSFG